MSVHVRIYTEINFKEKLVHSDPQCYKPKSKEDKWHGRRRGKREEGGEEEGEKTNIN